MPESAWWTHYYEPLEARLDELRQRYSKDPEALKLIGQEQQEIELYRQHSRFYGYVFYLARRSD